MKAIKCEMCGGNQLVKADGYYTCQSCGTKYTTEEAQKLIVETHIDISGSTVKIDHNAETETGLRYAREARMRKDYAGALRYYRQVALYAHGNWEVSFYIPFCEAVTDMTNVELSQSKILSAYSGTFHDLHVEFDNTFDRARLEQNLTCIVNDVIYAEQLFATTQKKEWGLFIDKEKHQQAAAYNDQVMRGNSRILYYLAFNIYDHFGYLNKYTVPLIDAAYKIMKSIGILVFDPMREEIARGKELKKLAKKSNI